MQTSSSVIWYENRDESILIAPVGFFSDFQGFSIEWIELILSPTVFSPSNVRFGIETLMEEI